MKNNRGRLGRTRTKHKRIREKATGGERVRKWLCYVNPRWCLLSWIEVSPGGRLHQLSRSLCFCTPHHHKRGQRRKGDEIVAREAETGCREERKKTKQRKHIYQAEAINLLGGEMRREGEKEHILEMPVCSSEENSTLSSLFLCHVHNLGACDLFSPGAVFGVLYLRRFYSPSL